MTPAHRFMERALRLAERGRGRVSPNPMVGACLVKNGKIIAEAAHETFGGPHAEVSAIQKAGKRARGATLFVTLEPCSTYGKTPPCTDLIQKAGVKRVVAAAADPNPKHRGRGLKLLKKSGVRVETGLLAACAGRQNESFFKWIRTGLPFVTLKMAQSMDGKIASRTGESRWISGPRARHWVHGLRASSDAVLVGKNTVLQDDPRLTVRPGKRKRAPWRIVLDAQAQISPNARVFSQPGPAILVCGEKYFARAVRKFRRSNATILSVAGKTGRLNLAELLSKLGRFGISSLLVEGGGETASSFLEAGLVDKIEWIIAPKIIGGRDAKTSVEGLGIAKLDQALEVRMTRIESLGQDLLLEGYVLGHR